MNMIDTSDKFIKNSPFNDINRMGEVPANPFEGIEIKSAQASDRLSTRASVFAAFIVIAVSFLMPSYAGDAKAYLLSALIAVGAAAAYVLFWTFTFRLFESPDMMPVSVVLNLLPGVLMSLFLKDRFPLIGLMFIGAGLTALSLEASDIKSNKGPRGGKPGFTGIDFLSGEVVKYTEFTMADTVGEVLVPFAFALVSSCAGVMLSELIRHFTKVSGVGIRLILGTLVLMLLSILVSKIRNRDFLLSSEELSDACLLPSTTYKHLRSFVLRRMRFLFCIAVTGAGCLLTDYFDAKFNLGMPFMKYVLSALFVFAFAFARGRQSKHRIQFATELAVIYAVSTAGVHSVPGLIVMSVFAFAADVLITSMMYTRNRQLIMTRRSRYVDGMPLILMSASLIYMACELFIGYFEVIDNVL